jgi:FtsP/CotA-like multicopper oxidase with cupredoxin domain
MIMNRREILVAGIGLMAAVVLLSFDAGRAQAQVASADYFGGVPNYANSPTNLQKFVDTLPGLCALGKNNLGQCIPLATPDTTTYDGSDYYEIGLKDYFEMLHSDLPKATRLRGYYQKNLTGSALDPEASVNHYLGPLILAQKNRPVRIKFVNELDVNGAGDLFIPVDTSVMGAGMGPDGMSSYSQNRATLHLHGGNTPWISDGTPHQWTVPAGESSTPYLKGVSSRDVPDMPATADGEMSFYWTNQQSGRLMFYHDHAYGITRLNVYAGEAAGYLLVDPKQEDLLRAATVPGTIPSTGDGVTMNLGGADLTHIIPLVIQDKTFVSANTLATDPTWSTVMPGTAPGDLWFPHVYMPNQWPDAPDLSGANPMGRWDYGPWFWPVFNMVNNQPIIGNGANNCPVGMTCPNIPNPSLVPEAFMDTPLINGTAYPTVTVAPAAYRFQILNACNDRFMNLSLFQADPANPTEVKMVPAIAPSGQSWPETWPTDNREGGVPDPATAGPAMIQIGTEGGLLPAPVVIPPTPVGYNYNRRDIVVLNVSTHALFLGPAERADVVIDFSQYAGRTLILYNDSPAPVPAFDPRYDYYTGNADMTASGGAPTTAPGFGPNIRTIMQIKVTGSNPNTTPFDPAALNAALPAIFAQTQDPIIVPQTAYPAQNGGDTAKNNYARISSTSLTFTNLSTGATFSYPLKPKAIQELFELDYGRMNAILGVELPFTNSQNQTTIPLGYIDPATETLKDGETQLWKITHNGVDTHAIHFHLFTVQVINRVGWDGAIRPPDENELSWKDTVKMNPLEDIVVALKPVKQSLPWPLPDSIRPFDVTRPTTATFQSLDPATGLAYTVTNNDTNFGWEYVWHCHLLGHEENDMMRPIIFQVPPDAPSNLMAMNSGADVHLNWTDNSASETQFTVQRDTDPAFAAPSTFTMVSGTTPTYNVMVANVDAGRAGTQYFYRVQANSPNGTSAWSNFATNGFTAYASAAPAFLAFGTQLVTTTSATQVLTLTNVGTAAITGIVTSLTGSNPGDFVQSNTCPGTLTPGSSCTINVNFAPTAMGPLTASLRISSSAPNTPLIPLSGAGTAPVATVLTTSLTFTGQPLYTSSAVQTVTLSNTGNAPLLNIGIAMAGANAGDFTQTNTCGSILSQGLTCLISVTYRPTTAGPSSAIMNITGSDTLHSPIPVGLSGTGIVQMAASVTPTSLVFGSQLLNSISTAQTVTLVNTGTAPLSITNITVPAGDFAISSNACTSSLAAGAGCPVTITFGPTLMGVRTSTLSITSNDPVNPTLSVPLSGTGIAPVNSVTPPSLLFSTPVYTTSAVQVVTVTNTGTAPMTISSIALGGPNASQFTQTTTCGTFPAVLMAGNSCTVNVTFKPTWFGTGTMNAQLNVNVDAPATSRSVALTGAVLMPVNTTSPPALTFTTSQLNVTSAAQVVTVANTGTAPMTIGSITLGGTNAPQFAQTTTCGAFPATLAAGGSCTVSVTFKPTWFGTGTMIAQLNVNVAAPATSQSVTLTGSILIPVSAVTPTSLNFSAPVYGTSAAQAVTVANTGTGPMTINSIALGGQNAPQFAQTSTCGTFPAVLAAGGSCTVNVTFKPTWFGTGTMRGLLNVNVAAPATSRSVSLTGTVQ